MQTKLKTCSRCKIEKDLTSFYKSSSSKDGYRYNCISCQKEEYTTGKEEHSRRMRNNYLKNKQVYTDRAKVWKKVNREKHNAGCMERYTIKINRCPAWAKELTELATLEAYDKAQRLEEDTGIPYDVDHIVPLKGKTVSGLHIFNNIQVIPASENRSKKNLYWPDMF